MTHLVTPPTPPSQSPTRAGTEARIRTVLTLTGVTHREALSRFAYMPYLVVDSVADIVPPGERGGD